jgi:nucleoside-diphosphate-sugar epimerase
MHVFLSGATGYIGSAILPRLVDHGHSVTAVVRSDEKAAAITAAGGSAVVDPAASTERLTELMARSDAAIHTAAMGDETAADFDRGYAEAAIAALAGSGKPYIHTGGCWVYGSGASITEADAYNPPAITAWRVGVQSRLESADLALTVLHPGIVYGHGAGLSTFLSHGPRTDDGRFVTIGSGEQHWTTIHVDDLAELYVAVLEAGSGFDAVLGVSGQNPRVVDLSAAAAGPVGVTTESDDDTRARIFAPLADALLLDQQAAGDKARTIGNWAPTRASLLEELGGA